MGKGLYNEAGSQENEKATYWITESICKLCIW